MIANKYRGQITLDLPTGPVVTVINSNALRLYMDDEGLDDINTAVERFAKNPTGTIPRLCFHGLANWDHLHGREPKLPKWETFAAQMATLDVAQIFEDVSNALTIEDEATSDDKKKA